MRRLLFIFSILALANSCMESKEEKLELVKQKGMEAVKELHETMRSNLKKAIKEKGPEGAIDFCYSKAEEFTKQVSKKVGFRIKRTSFKYRNENDKPDALDKKVLTTLEEKFKKTGKLPDYLIRKVTINGKELYVFYKPIQIKKPCLKCHGDVSKMDSEVVEVIKKHYPADKAVNYKEGDFRGVIRVDIPADKLN
jgi:hypothetical protein